MSGLINRAALVHQLSNLPGLTAWEKFAPSGRFPIQLSIDELRPSAVAVLLSGNAPDYHILYLQRTSRMGDNHSGQISFPGGKRDDEDIDLIDTAIRELHEETNILLDRSHLLGPLSPLPVPISRFIVHPFIFYIESLPDILLSTDEAEQAYQVPMTNLLNPANYKRTKIQTSTGITLTNTPYYDVIEGHVLWGATAMITSELIDIWQRI